MLLDDREAAKTACIDLGMAHDDVSLIFSVLGRKASDADRQRLEARYGRRGEVVMSEVSAFLQRLPRDLLFVSRSVGMVQGLNRGLGGTMRDRMRSTGEAAVRGLVLTDAVDAAGLGPKGAVAGGGGGEGAEVVASVALLDEGSFVRGGLWGIADALRPRRRRERLTYADALARGAIVFEPTESELLAAARGGRVLSAWETAAADSGVLWLRLRLAALDALLAVLPPLGAAKATVLAGMRWVGVLAAPPPEEAAGDSTDSEQSEHSEGSRRSSSSSQSRRDRG